MLESTRLIKFSKEGQYGPMIFLQDDANEFSAPDKDWCVFVDAKCDMAGVNWEKGNTITFSYTESSKNGRVSYYAKTMKNMVNGPMNQDGGHGGAMGEAPNTQSQNLQKMANQVAPDWDSINHEKARNIFLCGWMNNTMAGAAVAGISPSEARGWLIEGLSLWNDICTPQKPGDEPTGGNGDQGYDEGRFG
jgi:hypothetical protein